MPIYSELELCFGYSNQFNYAVAGCTKSVICNWYIKIFSFVLSLSHFASFFFFQFLYRDSTVHRLDLDVVHCCVSSGYSMPAVGSPVRNGSVWVGGSAGTVFHYSLTLLDKCAKRGVLPTKPANAGVNVTVGHGVLVC